MVGRPAAAAAAAGGRRRINSRRPASPRGMLGYFNCPRGHSLLIIESTHDYINSFELFVLLLLLHFSILSFNDLRNTALDK
jgi:hypothetical protein